MVENITNSQPTAAKTPEVAKKPSIRQQLKEFVVHYFSLLNFRPVEARQTLEIYPEDGTKPQMEFVFDRKALRENPNAELITFNSTKLKELIDLITEKGQVAKGFIPFTHNPVYDFENDIQELVACGQPPNPATKPVSPFLLNGTIELLEHHLKYAPFLVILLKITLKAVEPQELIETIVIPVIDEKEITARNANLFIEKVKVYLESPAPVITAQMPVPGELLDFTDQKVKDALQNAIQSIISSIEERKKTMNVRLAERYKKEIEIIEKYYGDREEEIKDKIVSDDERASDMNKSAVYRKQKKEGVPKLQDEIQQIQEELEAKRNECTEMYTISTDFKVVAAAAIYIPADFHYTCKLTSEYGSTERSFFYDIFEQVMIPPTCDSCGKPIYQGKLCGNLHLCCSTCGVPCKQCGKQVCRACDSRTCRICEVNLCKDHSFECARCVALNKPNFWACKEHVGACNACGALICDNCAITCAVCGKRFCLNESLCSTICNVCQRPICKEDAITCPICGKVVCKGDVGTCLSCHQTYCVSHLTTPSFKCETCVKCASRAGSTEFHKFRRTKGVIIHIPPQVGIPPSTHFVDVRVGYRNFFSPEHLAKIYMSTNKGFIIFQISRLLNNYIIVVNKETGHQTLYRNPRVLGRVKEYLTKKRQDLIFELQEPAVTGPKLEFASPNGTHQIAQILTREPHQGITLESFTCPKCAKKVAHDFNVCPYCGTKLRD